MSGPKSMSQLVGNGCYGNCIRDLHIKQPEGCKGRVEALQPSTKTCPLLAQSTKLVLINPALEGQPKGGVEVPER